MNLKNISREEYITLKFREFLPDFVLNTQRKIDTNLNPLSYEYKNYKLFYKKEPIEDKDLIPFEKDTLNRALLKFNEYNLFN